MAARFGNYYVERGEGGKFLVRKSGRHREPFATCDSKKAAALVADALDSHDKLIEIYEFVSKGDPESVWRKFYKDEE